MERHVSLHSSFINEYDSESDKDVIAALIRVQKIMYNISNNYIHH